MNFSAQETVDWLSRHLKDLQDVALTYPHMRLIMCPSFVALAQAHEILNHLQTPLFLGAQGCSAFLPGSHTGEIAATFLAELGCSYCIVGHSETRESWAETYSIIAQKIIRLFEHDLCPIICIGETSQRKSIQNVLEILIEQCKIILSALVSTQKHFALAYEPAWAIGTGVQPSAHELDTIFIELQKWLTSQEISPARYHVLYGGSVDEKTAATIAHVSSCRGILVGKASLTFQKFKNIVLLASNEKNSLIKTKN